MAGDHTNTSAAGDDASRTAVPDGGEVTIMQADAKAAYRLAAEVESWITPDAPRDDPEIAGLLADAAATRRLADSVTYGTVTFQGGDGVTVSIGSATQFGVREGPEK
ncbi:MAG TPA: hypothetical protein VNM48_23875 [Chloroflexota bacterium]|nr:hypothetical protein [Chloroflexota bacterium]